MVFAEHNSIPYLLSFMFRFPCDDAPYNIVGNILSNSNEVCINFNSIFQILKFSTGSLYMSVSDINPKDMKELIKEKNDNNLKPNERLLTFSKSKRLNCINAELHEI